VRLPTYGAPALSRLLFLKVRGTWRRQWRRLATPKGLVLTILGVILIGVWFSGLFLHVGRSSERLTAAAGELRVRGFGLLLTTLTLSSALIHRGLFLPRDEIERLFSAPVSRADLVRYRLLAGGVRGLVGGVVLGVLAMRRMPSPVTALIGTLLALQTLTALNQLAAILLGGLEQGSARLLGRAGKAFILIVVVGAVGAATALPALGAGDVDVPGLKLLLDALRDDQNPLGHPVLASATLPFVPWAAMIAAPGLQAFAPWLGVCLLLHVLVIEACARLPVDFRELSLKTSAQVSARQARVRRGGGAASMGASTRLARWRLPHLWGRSSVGAVAWRKGLGLLRKAKGTLLVSLLALGFLSLIARVVFQGMPQESVQWTPVMIGTLGTLYLCSGLRFDFREDLERMDLVRSWPLAPWKVFLGTILPEVCAVAVLVDAAVLANALALDGLGPATWAVLLCSPCVVLAWVALDNAVFLFAPVRLVPGQEGLLQNAGRAIVLMLLRTVLLALTAVFAGAPALGVYKLLESQGLDIPAALGAALAALFVGLLAVDGALIALGGLVLRRFDVARDRG
jgi:hypothetical protein